MRIRFLEKCVFATVFLTASPNLKDFSGKTGENINAFWGTL